jgi:hypothetical protein
MRNRQPYIWRNTVASLFTRITGTRWLRLNYDGQIAAFAVGEKCTGDGGANGVIVYLTSTTMYFASIDSRPFVNDEGLTGDASGDAVANGAEY